MFKQALASKLSDREKTAITIKFAKYILSAMMLCLTEMNSVKHISWVSSSMGSDIVYDMNEETEYEIIEQGPNFVYCQGEDAMFIQSAV